MRNIWLSKAEIMSLPTSGTAWDNVKSAADQATGAISLIDQESMANVQCYAAALVAVRTGDPDKLDKVKKSIAAIANFDTTKLDRALALGRELCAYVISADLIDLPAIDPTLNAAFSDKIKTLLTAKTKGGPASLIDCQAQRPNNWGMHASASIIAVQIYLGDTAGLKKSADIFKGWLGDRTAYAGFTYGGPEKDLSWQSDPKNPVGINPKGATIQGHNVDGMLPDDIRRSGSFTWPPSGAKAQMYSWEGLQGATVAAQLLTRAGYPAWEWCDKALLRAVTWLYNEAKWPAVGDDQWQPWLINQAYGTNFPTADNANAGKNMAFTQWTHAAPVIVKPPVPDPVPDPTPTPDCTACLEELAAVKAELATVSGKLKAITDLVLSQQGD